MRHSLEEIPELKGKDFIINDKNLALLNRDEEITLIKTIAQWPRVVEGAAQHFEPHRIVFYLQELAGAFHALWNRGKEDESLRFIIKDDILLTQARLALVKALAITIASGLHVIGVEPVREM